MDVTHMVAPSTRVALEELFQIRLMLENELLVGNLGDQQLRSSIDWLQSASGEKQLTPQVSATLIGPRFNACKLFGQRRWMLLLPVGSHPVITGSEASPVCQVASLSP